MQWTDLEWVSTQQKVACRVSASDLLAFPESHPQEPVALFPAGTASPPLNPGVWVTVVPMTETVKRVDDNQVVLGTVPREQVQIVGFPIVVPAALLGGCAEPDDALQRALATGGARPLVAR
ncbi:hypothetical protein [Cumulibacter soli]|uniref:hypothetical protein n=1 Tax=Cumulibacter soli TaxID=2546344 RepID=UPI001067998C|nr:hypothetical protein [Cumulibacter soli]